MTPVATLEGTWDEIAQHEAELRGHRLRVIVLPEDAQDERVANPDIARRLAILDEISRRCARMHPKPDPKDYLREGRAGAIWGYEPEE